MQYKVQLTQQACGLHMVYLSRLQPLLEATPSAAAAAAAAASAAAAPLASLDDAARPRRARWNWNMFVKQHLELMCQQQRSTVQQRAVQVSRWTSRQHDKHRLTASLPNRKQ
jgi:hypothetical protein